MLVGIDRGMNSINMKCLSRNLKFYQQFYLFNYGKRVEHILSIVIKQIDRGNICEVINRWK